MHLYIFTLTLISMQARPHEQRWGPSNGELSSGAQLRLHGTRDNNQKKYRKCRVQTLRAHLHFFWEECARIFTKKNETTQNYEPKTYATTITLQIHSGTHTHTHMNVSPSSADSTITQSLIVPPRSTKILSLIRTPCPQCTLILATDPHRWCWWWAA